MKFISDIQRIALLTVLGCAAGVFAVHSADSRAVTSDRWPAPKASAWAKQTGWLVGCNYIPSTAINQLEMWQADTFDPRTIDRELGWAQQLGFDGVRVFLHNLLWQQDSVGFLKRMDQFLDLADKHHIKVTFVLFDSCWNPDPKPGQQPRPQPFVHNSGWVQSPGLEYTAHPERLVELKPYVQGVVGHFRDDNRIAFWDVFNEPDNMNDPAYLKQEPAAKSTSALLLLKEVFAWAREMNPGQPLTSGVWRGDWGDPAKLSAFEEVQLGQSDIITFHNYGRPDSVEKCIQNLRRYGRPIICTEYMARPMGSTFNPILGDFKKEGVGALTGDLSRARRKPFTHGIPGPGLTQVSPPSGFMTSFIRTGHPTGCRRCSIFGVSR